MLSVLLQAPPEASLRSTLAESAVPEAHEASITQLDDGEASEVLPNNDDDALSEVHETPAGEPGSPKADPHEMSSATAPEASRAEAQAPADAASQDDLGSLLLERELSAPVQDSDAESDEMEELLRKTSSRLPRRPDSAQVAALIEGYNNDFAGPVADPLEDALSGSLKKPCCASHDGSRVC
jgi:hypothetical protein